MKSERKVAIVDGRASTWNFRCAALLIGNVSPKFMHSLIYPEPFLLHIKSEYIASFSGNKQLNKQSYFGAWTSPCPAKSSKNTRTEISNLQKKRMECRNLIPKSPPPHWQNLISPSLVIVDRRCNKHVTPAPAKETAISPSSFRSGPTTLFFRQFNAFAIREIKS